LKGVLASTKHYFGDGATFGGYDEGNCRVDNFDVFYNNNVQGYIGALESNTGTIMVSYSAINNLPMSISELINVDLK
jgi:beta-glucosidase